MEDEAVCAVVGFGVGVSEGDGDVEGVDEVCGLDPDADTDGDVKGENKVGVLVGVSVCFLPI